MATICGLISSSILFLPDIDGYSLKFSNGSSLVTWLTNLDSQVIQKRYSEIAILLTGFIFTFNLKELGRSKVGYGFLGLLFSVCIYTLFLQVSIGLGPLEAVRNQLLEGFYILLISCAVGISLAKSENFKTGLFLGCLVSGFLRLLFSYFTFRSGGGAQFVEGVSSFASDGGLLVLWGLLASIGFLYLVRAKDIGDFRGVSIWGFVLLVFGFAIAATFRRNAALKMIFLSAIGTLIYYSGRKKVFKGAAIVVASTFVLGFGLFGVLSLVFGADKAIQRLESISLTASGEFSGSNSYYIDDWMSLPDSIIVMRFLGSGLGGDYGVARLTNELVEEGVVPLHTGAFELWASIGFMGALFHSIALIFIPLRVISVLRNHNDHVTMGPIISAAFVLAQGLWPFGPPFYTQPQTSVLIGFCLGICISSLRKYSSASERNRNNVKAISEARISLA